MKEERAVTQFDMRGQNVTNQYNAGHDINFGSVQTPADLVAELEKLRTELAKAKEAGIINDEQAIDAEYQITKAVQLAQKPNPDKETILDHLNTAKTFIEGIAAAGGLVTTLVTAVQAVQKLF